MNISEKIKEEWSNWIECSKEEYIQNQTDRKNYTYIIDQDTNRIAKYMKRKDMLIAVKTFSFD
jgi:hypothetical protein